MCDWLILRAPKRLLALGNNKSRYYPKQRRRTSCPRHSQQNTSASRYHGSIGAAAIIVSVEEPTEEAKRALTASFKALGYSPQAIGWAQTAAPGKSDASGDLFTLIEGIDPFCVVSTSHASTEALSRCYNTPLAIEAKTLLLGRDCRCFENLDALITTEAGKHKTWGLLKTLPKM